MSNLPSWSQLFGDARSDMRDVERGSWRNVSICRGKVCGARHLYSTDLLNSCSALTAGHDRRAIRLGRRLEKGDLRTAAVAAYVVLPWHMALQCCRMATNRTRRRLA